MVLSVLLVLAAYFVGSLASAVLLSRWMGLPDPRTQGSGNPGATNVLRLGSKKAAALTLLGDSLKGFLPVFVAYLSGSSLEVQALVALAAFLGHLYPIFFGFRGGKGVATALGVLLGLAPILALVVATTWIATFVMTRISAASALTAAVLAPFYAEWLVPVPTPLPLAVLVMALLLIERHQTNIRRWLTRDR